MRVRVADELGAGGAEREGPGAGVAVGLESARMSPSAMPSPGMRVSTRVKARTGPVWHEDRVIRRVSPGTGGLVSLRTMVAAER